MIQLILNNLESMIGEEFDGADRRLLNYGYLDNYWSRKIRNNWSKIYTDRRKKLQQKIQGISDICL